MKHTLAAPATLAALTAAVALCFSAVQANTQCSLYTKSTDDERKENYHWSYVTSLTKQPFNDKDPEYDTWSDAGWVVNKAIFFQGSIHKGSVPNQGGLRAVYMENRLNDTRIRGKQDEAHFRVQWILKSVFDKGAPNPNYLLESGDNTSCYDESVPFQAEDVIGVSVFQRKDGA